MENTVNFIISLAARRRIEEICADYKEKRNVTDVIPAIVWLSSELNRGRFESHPGLGFYVDRAEIEDSIEVIDGLELVYAIHEDDRRHFEGKLLDYNSNENRFLLIDSD